MRESCSVTPSSCYCCTQTPTPVLKYKYKYKYQKDIQIQKVYKYKYNFQVTPSSCCTQTPTPGFHPAAVARLKKCPQQHPLPPFTPLTRATPFFTRPRCYPPGTIVYCPLLGPHLFFYSSPRCYPPGTIVPFFLRKLEDTSAAWTTLNFSCLSTIQDNTDKPPFSLETSCRIYNVYTFFP